MTLFKRCTCKSSCKHAWWYRFRFKGREHKRSTGTPNRTLSEGIAAKRRVEVQERKEGMKPKRVPKVADHILAYTEWTQARNRTSSKDPDVLCTVPGSSWEQAARQGYPVRRREVEDETR